MSRTDQDRQQDVERARRAQELIDDPLLAEAFQSVRDYLSEAWLTTGEGDMDRREEIFRRIKSLEHVRTALDNIMRNGKLSQYELNSLTAQGR